jgi:uncharacterized membrane protein YphA (DoxX/SURF4 family)
VRNPLASPRSMSLGLFLARVPLGAFFVMAGFGKFTAPGGVAGFVSKFAGSVPAWAPQVAGRYYLQAVPYAEIVVGASLVLGVAGRLGGLAAALMLASFTIAVTGVRSANQPFQPNLIFIGLALLVFFAGPGSISMDKVMWGKGKPAGGEGDR